MKLKTKIINNRKSFEIADSHTVTHFYYAVLFTENYSFIPVGAHTSVICVSQNSAGHNNWQTC